MTDNAVNSVKAIYRTTGVSSHEGNPLIEALPPIMSTKQICDSVQWLPTPPSAEDRQKPVELRIHELPKVRKLIYALPEYGLHSSVMSVILREGYTNRNPVHVETWQQLYYSNVASDRPPPPPEPNAHRASGVIFSGLSGMGKSTFMNRFLQLYPQVIQHSTYKGREFIHPQLVWIKIDCPGNGSLSGLVLKFFEAVDKALGTRYVDDYFPKGGKTPTQPVLLRTMARIAANYFLGVLIIDELQNLNRAKTQGDEGFLTFLSSLVEHIGVPVIGVGTPAVTKLFKNALQHARRAAAMGFYNFQRFDEEEDAWTEFLESIIPYCWLEKPIELTPELKSALYDHSQGITAILIALFVLAQYRCLAENCVFDRDVLDSVAMYELAPLQDAIRMLRNGNTAALQEYEDLSFDKTWEKAIECLEHSLQEAALNRKSAGKPSPTSKKTSKQSAPGTEKKGASSPSADSNDLRNLSEFKDPYEELRARGVVPTNIFSMGGDQLTADDKQSN